jgi:hypothetical protein
LQDPTSGCHWLSQKADERQRATDSPGRRRRPTHPTRSRPEAHNPADQNGAPLSGFFTVRDHSTELSTFAVLDWSISISEPGLGSFTTGQNDPSAMLSPLGKIVLTPTEMTIAPGAGWLLVQSDNVLLSYARNPNDQYEGQGGNAISWLTNSPSMGGTDSWVIARTLGIAAPEPSSFVLVGTAILGLGIYREWRRYQFRSSADY